MAHKHKGIPEKLDESMCPISKSCRNCSSKGTVHIFFFTTGVDSGCEQHMKSVCVCVCYKYPVKIVENKDIGMVY